MNYPEGEITLLLSKFDDPESIAALMRLVYDDLHRMAASHHRNFWHGRPRETLRPTALVSETYIRLMKSGVTFENRAHFFGAASHAMRRVLLDHARKELADKRGGASVRVELDENHAISTEDPSAILALDQALERLSAINPKYRQIAELRYFGAFTTEETAEILGMKEGTLRRDWARAVKLLRKMMQDSR
jgi:RNA polymerase sigma factor (TIGR02999 family)